MEKKRVIKKRKLITYLMLKLSSAVLVALLALIILIAAFVFLMKLNVILPENEGEKEAISVTTELNRVKKFPEDFKPKIINYVYVNKSNHIIKTSLSKEKANQLIEHQELSNSSTKEILFNDGSKCIVQWKYATLFSGPLKNLLSPTKTFSVLMLIILLSIIIITFYKIKTFLNHQLEVVNLASYNISKQQINIPINTEVPILEFFEVLTAMETLRRNLSESLRDRKTLEKNKAREFAALSHDIKTPLTIIQGNSELLLEEKLDPNIQKMVSDIHKSSKISTAYLDKLQTLSNQDLVINKEEKIFISEIFNDVKIILDPLLSSKALILKIQYDNDFEITIFKKQLIRVLVSLVENAIRYTHKGYISMSSTLNKNDLTIIVEDTGVGFSIEALQHAKELFWTEDTSRSSQYNYGIGLSQANSLALQYSGNLMLSNTNTGGKVELHLKNCIGHL